MAKSAINIPAPSTGLASAALQTELTLWHAGVQVAGWKGRTNPWELDFLRGMHQGPSLQILAWHLMLACRTSIRLKSLWLDKHVWAHWQLPGSTNTSRHELADLAVIVRHRSTRRTWMWLLQAKRVVTCLAPYPKNPSTKAELDLLHRMPIFSVVNTSFDLRRDFPKSAQPSHSWRLPAARVPWTFLDLHAGLSAPLSGALAFPHPIAVRWPGTRLGPPPPAQLWTKAKRPELSSYVSCLEALITGTSSRWYTNAPSGRTLIPGAAVGNGLNNEWTKLHSVIVRRCAASYSKHARTKSNPTGATLQFGVGPNLPGTSSLQTYARAHAMYGDPKFSDDKMLTFALKSALAAFSYDDGRSPTDWISDEEAPEPGGMQVLFIDC